MLAFDIETGPLDEETVLKFAAPFEAPAHPGEFDAKSVKVGNLKDQAKIDAKIAEAREAHAVAVAAYESTVATAEKAHREAAIGAAPLSPVTGQVLAIGYRAFDGRMAIDDGEGHEDRLLLKFWRKYENCRKERRKMCGCNILGFDLPFVIRRSWILGVEVPGTVKPARWFDEIFVDLRDVWLLGQRWGDCPSSLDVMARALGCGEKNGDGAEFWKLWQSQETREQAVAYLKNDLEMTGRVAERLGIV